MRSLMSVIGLTAILCVAMSTIARADIADQRTTEVLSALRAGKFGDAETNFDPTAKAQLPPEKLESVWEQIISELGPLKSFEITMRVPAGAAQVRIVRLHFESASSWVAQVIVNSSGQVAGLLFTASSTEKASPAAQSKADDVVNQLLDAIRSAKFADAEQHFDETTKSKFPPGKLEKTWKSQTASLRSLKRWRIVDRSDAPGGVQMRIINLDFASKPKALALKIAVDPSGAIGGLLFVKPVAEPVPSAAPTPPSHR
jgi:hypothetical protein